MSSTETESELSSEELRSKLFHSFKSKGVLNSVKTQLRNRIALELQQKTLDKHGKVTKKYIDHGSLLMQASNSLFIDHLKQCSYNYTLSVFVSESLTNPEKTYSIKDILQLLHINPESKLHKKLMHLSTQDGDVKGFLWSFLLHFAESHNFTFQDTSVQTDEDYHPTFGTLDQKLLDVEKLQLHKLQQLGKDENSSLEARVLAYQRQYEAQKRAELSAEMEQFRSSELANMRLEEQEKYRHELSHAKKENDEILNKKLKELEKQQNEISVDLRRQRKILETDAYEQRQKILAGLQDLKEKELEMKKIHELAMKSVDIDAEKLRSKREILQYKEESLSNTEDRYENKLKDEIIKAKFEMQQEEKQSYESLNIREQQLREEKISFQSQKENLMRWKQDAERLKEENHQLNLSLMAANQNLNSLTQKCDHLSNKNHQLKDYKLIKEDNILLRKDLEIARRNIDDILADKERHEKDHQNLVTGLLGKISGAGDTDLLKASVSKEMEEQRLKERSLREKCNNLQNKYDVEVSKNEELGRLYEDSLLSQRELLREVDELRTAYITVNKEKEKLMKNTLKGSNVAAPDYSQKHKTLNPINSGQVNKNSDVNKKYQIWLENNVTAEIPDNFINKVDSSSEAMKRLEQEALDLENSYKDFQERQKVYESKSPSRVHFSSYVQKRSKSPTSSYGQRISSSESFDLSRLIPGKTLSYPKYVPSVSQSLQQKNPSNNTGVVFSSTTLSQPLSSTQAPGAFDAPSFGISGVNNQDTFFSKMVDIPNNIIRENSPPTSDISQFPPVCNVNTNNMHQATLGNVQDSSLIPSVYQSLTQYALPGTTLQSESLAQNTHYPLPGTTLHGESLTQYTLQDTRYHNTLTQYPLIESELKTPALKGRDLVTPMTRKLDTLTELSQGPEVSTEIKNDDRNQNNNVEDTLPNQDHGNSIKRISSVEFQYGLRETSITTFESPTKDLHAINSQEKVSVADVFYTPAAPYKDPTSNRDRELDNNADKYSHNDEPYQARSASAISSESLEQQRLDEPSIVTTQSSSISKLDMNELVNSPTRSLSDGEIDISGKDVTEDVLEQPNKDKIVGNDEGNDMMATYMKMVLQKRETEEKNVPSVDQPIPGMQNSISDDLAMSNQSKDASEKSSISEFDW